MGSNSENLGRVISDTTTISNNTKYTTGTYTSILLESTKYGQDTLHKNTEIYVLSPSTWTSVYQLVGTIGQMRLDAEPVGEGGVFSPLLFLERTTQGKTEKGDKSLCASGAALGAAPGASCASASGNDLYDVLNASNSLSCVPQHATSDLGASLLIPGGGRKRMSQRPSKRGQRSRK